MSLKKRESVVPDIESFPKEDVVDEYEKLAVLYSNLKRELDECKQQLHHEKTQGKMLRSSQNDLQSELESITNAHKKELRDCLKNSGATIEVLREKTRELTKEKSQLESVTEELSKQLVESQKQNDDLRYELTNRKPATRYSDASTKILENELAKLQQVVDETLASEREKTQIIESQRLQIEEFDERLICLKDNLESKKSEIQEKNEAIEALQEKVQEAIEEIATLKASPDDPKRKGNSLFAEVDDQRQKMKKVLQGERAHYNDMKQICNAKEMKIRQLKRENMNIKQEIQVCAGLLRRGEQIEIETMSAELNKLRNDNKDLESRLKMSERRLNDLATEQNLDWVNSVLSTSSEETSKLRSDQMVLMIQNTSLADSLHKSQKELVQIRLDCVKLKMFLRRIVDLNNIKIRNSDYVDIGLDNEVIEGIKVEEFENIICDENEEASATCAPGNDELNESILTLIGGRERLKKLIPSVFTEKSAGLGHDKENSEKLTEAEKSTKSTSPKKPIQRQSSHQTSSLSVAIHSPPKPLRSLQTTSPAPAKERSVKFSDVVRTECIDESKEQYEQSKEARKRSTIVIKRINIPSKVPVKKV